MYIFLAVFFIEKYIIILLGGIIKKIYSPGALRLRRSRRKVSVQRRSTWQEMVFSLPDKNIGILKMKMYY